MGTMKAYLQVERKRIQSFCSRAAAAGVSSDDGLWVGRPRRTGRGVCSLDGFTTIAGC